jgi:hypothetical protein
MNTTVSLLEAFNNAVFHIPPYQRAYSWGEKQLEAFVHDLRDQYAAQHESCNEENNKDKKQYFLGTILLHLTNDEVPKNYDIVDGQQRLTTAVIFIATALQAIEKRNQQFPKNIGSIKRGFIFDSDQELQKFHTINEDDPFLSKEILGLPLPGISISNSPSTDRMLEAKQYFLSTIKDEEFQCLLDILVASQIITYIVNNPADATQIFELQNDRGKRLTDLESIKSYLMHTIYLNAVHPIDHLNKIQTIFSKLYRTIEQISTNNFKPGTEDSILSYHCIGYLQWREDDWRNPKDLIKRELTSIPKNKKNEWVARFSEELLQSFLTVQEILTASNNDTEYLELGELLALNRMAAFWPLLIKIWPKDTTRGKQNVRKCCRLCELFCFKGYAIAGIRSDTGTSKIRSWTKNFSGDFEDLFQKLFLLSQWWDIPERFITNLQSPYFYNFNNADIRYFYWKYENFLRNQTGQHQPLLSWKSLFLKDTKKKFSIEHIESQNTTVLETEVSWNATDDPKKFKDIALHRMGNLVLDTVSLNSAKQDDPFWDKMLNMQFKSQFVSENELRKWAQEDHGELYWTLGSIKARHEHLLEFAKKIWDPSQYFQGLVVEQCSTEEEDDQLEGQL